MDEAFLDTDILSEVLKAKDATVLGKAQQYLNQYGQFSFSAITFYEVVRGMHAAGATKQLANFLQLADKSDVLPISLPILLRSADLWATAYAGGHPRADADLIIAIWEELSHGIIKPDSRSVARSMLNNLADNDAEAMVLGCTELCLLINPEDSPRPLYDTTELHAKAILSFALN